jgi:hypothetical protein
MADNIFFQQPKYKTTIYIIGLPKSAASSHENLCILYTTRLLLLLTICFSFLLSSATEKSIKTPNNIYFSILKKFHVIKLKLKLFTETG